MLYFQCSIFLSSCLDDIMESVPFKDRVASSCSYFHIIMFLTFAYGYHA